MCCRFAKPGVDNTQTTTKLGAGHTFGKRKLSSDGAGPSKRNKTKRSGGARCVRLMFL